jgi:hypothetical protein
METTRTDIHRPSQIIPSDYNYIAICAMNIQGIGDCEFILRERETIRRHMDKTGGTYAHVETSGSCQVCGNVQAIYLALFYHEASNSYLRVGFDCTQKLEMSGDFAAFNMFRKNVQNAREAQAGKRKAIAILGDLGLAEAWDIFTADWPLHSDDCASKSHTPDCTICDGSGQHERELCTCDVDSRRKLYNSFPESTIRDIVGKLVKYGSVSPKQTDFIGKLLKQIADRPIVEAQRQAEADAAGPVPTGRVQMTGTVLSVKQVEGRAFSYHDDGVRTKLLIKLENGSKVYGNRFANIDKGDNVTFTATVEASKTDAKFGFYKRASLPATEPTETAKRNKKAIAKLKRVMKAAGMISAKGMAFSAWEQQQNGTPELYTAYVELSNLQNELYTEIEDSNQLR